MLAVIRRAGYPEAHAHRAERAGAVGIHFHRVESVACLGGADLRGIHRVVAELLLGELMLRVADLPIRRHAARIELDLHFHIGSGDLQRARQLGGKFVPHFLGRVEKGIAPVAVAREDFEQVVVVTFPADAEAIERNALLAVGLDLLLERLRIDVAQVGRAVREQHHAVDPVSQVMPQRRLVGQVHRVFQIRAALRGELGQGHGDCAGITAGRAISEQPRRAGESDNAEFVLRLQLLRQHAQRLVDYPHPVGALHRAGVVEQQHEVQRAARLAALRGGLD